MGFKTTKSGVPVLSKEDIEAHANKVISDYDNTLLYQPRAVPIEDIIERYFKLDMEYKTLDKDGSILGMTVFNNGYLDVYNKEQGIEEKIKVSKGTIIIDDSLIEDEKLLHRYRFTCSHEVSHWILHKNKYDTVIEGQMNLFGNYSQDVAVKCLNRSIESAFGDKEACFKDDDDWLEWQADYMGAALLLPKRPFLLEYKRIMEIIDARMPYLYLDNQPCNIREYYIVINRLVNVFNVSKKAVHVRLTKLNLLRGEEKQLYFA
jgi:Zn-dependent peptidase ImmA (M78 family)